MTDSLLATALRSAIASIHKNLRKQSYSVKSWSMTEMETIGHLNRNAALSPSALAALTHITTQSMSQILSKLENSGLIMRIASEKDKRKVLVSLTDAGKQLVKNTQYERDAWLENAIVSELSHAERDLLEHALPVLQKLTGSRQ